jgi:2-dehydropantoate 2-reductase
MKNCVLGAGAVGGYVGGMIASHDLPVTVLCRPSQKDLMLDRGLKIDGPQGEFNIPAFPCEPESPDAGKGGMFVTCDPKQAVEDADLILVSVKSQDTESLLETISPHVKRGATVLLLQNGVRNLALVKEKLPDNPCMEAVVLFNALYVKPGEMTLTATESVIFDSEVEDHPGAQAASRLLLKAGISTRFHKNVHGILWTKLIINLNNGISALTGKPLFEGLKDRDTRFLGRCVMAEGMKILQASGIEMEPIPKVEPKRLLFLLRTPGWFMAFVLKLMIKPYQDVHSSTWQSRVRNRPTEIDYLSGEIVRLARENGLEAPANEQIQELVHETERTGDGKVYTPGELRELLGV